MVFGLFNRESKKNKKYFEEIKKWIKHFSQKSTDLHLKHKELYKKHNELVKYMRETHQYLRDLNEDNQKIKLQIHELKNQMLTKEDIEIFLTGKVNSNEKDIDVKAIEDKILNKIKSQLTSQPIKEKKIEEKVEEQVKKPEIKKSTLELSYSEKIVLNVLFSADQPLSYETIGNRLNKKQGTIKVYVNNLKKKGLELEEFTGPGNIKLYALTNKEKIKKLYNMNY